MKGGKKKCHSIEESASFRKECKKYKMLLKGKKPSYKQQLLKEMTTLKSSNPKLYCDILTIIIKITVTD